MKKMILIVCMCSAAILVQRMVRRHQQHMVETIEEIETGRIRWQADEAEQAYRQASTHYTEATRLLQDQQLQRSYGAFRSARAAIHIWQEQHGHQQLSNGQTIQVWVRAQEAPYLQAVPQAFEQKLAALETGAIPYPDVKQLAQSFDHIGIKAPQQMLDENFQRIAATRAHQAHNWMRVVLPYEELAYNSILKSALEKKFQNDYGLKVVYGYAMDHQETKATWKTAQVRSELKYAYYEHINKKRYHQTAPPRIPETLILRFKMEGTGEVPTSWDNLDPVQVTVEVPDTLINKETITQQAIHEAQVGLLKAITEKLDQLPDFRLFPDYDPTQLTVVEKDRLNMDAARILGYIDRPRLMNILETIRKTDDPARQENLCLLCISLNLKEGAPWVEALLPKLESRRMDPVLRALEKKPWYGNYRPLIALIDQLDPHNHSSYLLQMLEKQLDHVELKAAVLRRIEAGPEGHRRNFTSAYIRNVPTNEAVTQARSWMMSPDRSYAKSVFNDLRNQHGEPAYQLALELYEEDPTRVREWLGFGRGFMPGQYPQGWTIVRESLATDPEKNRWAFELAKGSLQQAEAWDIVAEALKKYDIPHLNTGYIQSRLVYNIRQAHPEKALAYLLAALDHTDPGVREAAASQLLAGDEDKGDALRAIVMTYSQHPEHKRFIPEVINAIYRYRSKPGWDFSADQTNLRAILISGMRQEDKGCRSTTGRILQRLIKDGYTHYQEDLERAAQEEQDPGLKAKLQTAVASTRK